MIPSQSGIDLIKGFESCKLTAYQDRHGIWTIGWGCIFYFDQPYCPKVQQGDAITQDKADIMFAAAITTVASHINNLVKVTLNQNQFDAIVSFAYNIGTGEFKTSQFLVFLNAGNNAEAENELLKWDHCNGVIVLDLVRRRQKELALFLQPCA